MGRNAYVFWLVLIVVISGGCASERSAKETKTTGTAKEKIQGMAQIVLNETNQIDKALSAGGPAVYLFGEGKRRYRLFLKTPFEIEGGKDYAVEGINAQKVIDELGDPDQGKNGYPLLSSCKRVVTMAWPAMALDITEGHALALRERVRRYPARPVFLVTRIQPVEAAAASKKAAESGQKDIPEIDVPAEKQQALLIGGPTVQPAPLWEPAGGTVRCKVLIDAEGKISELRTGAQLCESVPWSQFSYRPTVQRGRPVQVKTEVEVRFEPRKTEAAT